MNRNESERIGIAGRVRGSQRFPRARVGSGRTRATECVVCRYVITRMSRAYLSRLSSSVALPRLERKIDERQNEELERDQEEDADADHLPPELHATHVVRVRPPAVVLRVRADVSSSGRTLRVRALEATRERGAFRDDGFRRGGRGSRRSARRRSCRAGRGGDGHDGRCGDNEHREGGMTRRGDARMMCAALLGRTLPRVRRKLFDWTFENVSSR